MATTMAHRYPSNTWLMTAGMALLAGAVAAGFVIWQLQRDTTVELPASSSSAQAFSPEAIRAENETMARSLGVPVGTGSLSPEAIRMNLSGPFTAAASISPEEIRAHNGSFVPSFAVPTEAFSPEAVRQSNVAASTEAKASISPEAIRASNYPGS